MTPPAFWHPAGPQWGNGSGFSTDPCKGAPVSDRSVTEPLGRPFWTLWSAFSATNLADGLSLVALPLLAIRLTGDARLIAAVTAFQYLPFLVIGLPAGTIIDRFDRRWIAVIAQTGRAIVMAALGLALLSGRPPIGWLFLVAFLIGCAEVLTDGGLPAIVRDLVRNDQLEVANARMMATQRVTNAFVGPPLGAALFGLDDSIPFLVSAAITAVGILALIRIPGSHRPANDDERGSLRVDMQVGLRFVWGHPVLRPLVVAVAMFSFVGAALNATSVVLMKERFGLSDLGYGLILSLDAVVAVITSFFVAGLIRRTSHGFSQQVSVVCFTVASFLLGFTTVAAVAFVAVAINGIADPTWNIVSATVRQRLVPDQVFGRMMTAYLFIAWGMRPAGAFLGGVIAEEAGPEWVMILAGTVVGSLLITARSLFSRVDAAMAEAD